MVKRDHVTIGNYFLEREKVPMNPIQILKGTYLNNVYAGKTQDLIGKSTRDIGQKDLSDPVRFLLRVSAYGLEF